MYTEAELHTLIKNAREGWLPDEGQVFTVTMTPGQRDSLLSLLPAPEETTKPDLAKLRGILK